MVCPASPPPLGRWSGTDEPCAECSLRRLEEAELTGKGSLLHRANDLRAILALGVTIPIDDLDADELSAMLIIENELDRLDKERKGN